MRFPAHMVVRGFVVLTLLFHAFAPGALANQDQERQRTNIKTELKEFLRTNNPGWAFRLSSDRRRVTSLVGRRTKPYEGEPLEKATQFLKEHARLFGFDFSLGDFRVVTSRITKFSAHLELQQIFKQLPVDNGGIQINFDKEGRVVQFVSSFTPTAGAVDRATISKDRAIKIAIEEFLRTTSDNPEDQRGRRGALVAQSDLHLNVPPRIEDVFFSKKERLRIAYKIHINAAKPFGIKEFVIDANNGEVMQRRNFIATSVDGTAQVFIPNPVNSLNDSSIRDCCFPSFHNPNPYYTVPLLGLATLGSNGTLQGSFVILQNIEDPDNTPPTAASPFDFVFERSVTSFQEVMVYYHITRNQLYVQSLGLAQILNRPILVDAHGSLFDVSQYVGEATYSLPKHILFGDGGVDDAEDGDVIIHEYAHALQDDQAPGIYSAYGYPEAMREGFGDYWAFSSFDEVTVEHGHDRYCIGEWNNVPDCLRRVDSPVFGDDFHESADPHTNGLIWSRTLLEIYMTFNKTTADRLILQSHFNVPNIPQMLTFELGAEAIIAADMELYQGVHIGDLCRVFKSRGIYEGAKCPGPFDPRRDG